MRVRQWLGRISFTLFMIASLTAMYVILHRPQSSVGTEADSSPASAYAAKLTDRTGLEATAVDVCDQRVLRDRYPRASLQYAVHDGEAFAFVTLYESKRAYYDLRWVNTPVDYPIPLWIDDTAPPLETMISYLLQAKKVLVCPMV